MVELLKERYIGFGIKPSSYSFVLIPGLIAAVVLSLAVAALFEGLLEFRHIQRLSMTIHVSK